MPIWHTVMTLEMTVVMTSQLTVVMTDVDGGYVQLVRDLCSWCGLRQVSRRTFVRALEEKGSVMLVPGGQAELVHTWRIKCKKEFVVYGKHKGQHPSLRQCQSYLPLVSFELGPTAYTSSYAVLVMPSCCLLIVVIFGARSPMS